MDIIYKGEIHKFEVNEIDWENMFKENLLEVLFTKVDGAIRSITGTKNEDIIFALTPPENRYKSYKPSRKINPDVLPVCSVTESISYPIRWKTFRKYNVKNIVFLPNETVDDILEKISEMEFNKGDNIIELKIDKLKNSINKQNIEKYVIKRNEG